MKFQVFLCLLNRFVMIFKNVDDDKNEANVIVIKKEDVEEFLVDKRPTR